ARVASISLADIRQGGPAVVAQKLCALQNNQACVVNCVSMRDLQIFVLGLLEAEAQDKTFLYRTAASFVQVRAGITPRPLLTSAELTGNRTGGGLVVVGSYVPKTSSQLGPLLAMPEIVSAEVNVAA